MSYKQNPEEIFLDKERSETIKEFWGRLKEKLTKKEFDTLMMFMSQKNKTRATGRELGIDEKQVRRNLSYIRKKAMAILAEIDLNVEDFKDTIKPQINISLPRHSQGVGYPFEKYIGLAKNKRWNFRYGSMKLPVNKTCMIPEYLKASGCDGICNICSESQTCSRIDAFPENGESEAEKAHAKEIERIMRSIKRNTRPEDYVGLERVANF